MILGIIAFLGALFGIVLFHEAGHLLAAKKVGMPASVFSVGFGPRLWGFRWRGTEYRLSAIPLGGYVRVDPMEEVVEGPDGPTTRFDTWPMKARVLVVSAGILMNVALAGALYVAVPLAWGVQPEEELRVGAVEVDAMPGDVARSWRALPRDAHVVAVDGRPVDDWRGLYLALAGRRAGPVELGLADRRVIRVTMPASDADKMAILGALRPAAPATLAGPPAGGTGRGEPRRGDRIVAAGGAPVTSWGAWRDHLESLDGAGTVALVVEGGEGRRSLELPVATARRLERADVRTAVGLGGAMEEAGRSLAGTVEVVRESWMILASGRLSVRQISGPLTIAGESVRIFNGGWEPFLRFVAFLSLNIAVMNALPIPALDGGFLAMMGVEAVRRRPLSATVQGYLGRVGMIWLCLVMAGTVVNDLLRLGGL